MLVFSIDGMADEQWIGRNVGCSCCFSVRGIIQYYSSDSKNLTRISRPCFEALKKSVGVVWRSDIVIVVGNFWYSVCFKSHHQTTHSKLWKQNRITREPWGFTCMSAAQINYVKGKDSGLTRGWVQIPPPEIPKALQNRAKHNPIVKTVKNCWI